MRPLFNKKQQDILALLQKGCSLRETTKTVFCCKSSVQRLCHKHFIITKLLVGGRSRKLTSATKQFCVSDLIRRKMSTTREITKHCIGRF